MATTEELTVLNGGGHPEAIAMRNLRPPRSLPLNKNGLGGLPLATCSSGVVATANSSYIYTVPANAHGRRIVTQKASSERRTPSPPDYQQVKNGSVSIDVSHRQSQRNVRRDDENDETDEELVEALGNKEYYDPTIEAPTSLMKPTKTQVLLYFRGALNFKLKRAGGDMQITDGTDCPLFDVWLDMDCCRCTWVIEAYGRTVLLLHEKTSMMTPLCCSRGLCRPVEVEVCDWNGEVFGYLVPGDPFLLQTPDKHTVAKLIPHSPAPVPILEDDGSGVPLEKRLCWLCVLEGSGRHIARVEDFDSIMFNKEVSFQLKLLALAGIVRLSSPWMMPGRGESRHAMHPVSRAISSILNCCAYCFY